MSIKNDTKSNLERLQRELESELKNSKNINISNFLSKVEQKVKDIYSNAISSSDRRDIRNIGTIFDVNTKVDKSKNKIDVELGSKLFFDNYAFELGKVISVKIVVKDVSSYRYAILNSSDFRNVSDDNFKLKMVKTYDLLVGGGFHDIRFDDLKKMCMENAPPKLLADRYAKELVFSKNSNFSGITKDFMKANYNGWRDLTGAEIKKIAEIYQVLKSERKISVKFDDVLLLLKRWGDVEGIINRYKLEIGREGETSGNYRAMTTKLALAKGLNGSGAISNTSSIPIFFAGNDESTHGGFEGTLKPGERAPKGIDVDFIYFNGNFYKANQGILVTLFGETEIMNKNVKNPNFIRWNDVDWSKNSAMKNNIVIDNQLESRRKDYERKYNIDFDKFLKYLLNFYGT